MRAHHQMLFSLSDPPGEAFAYFLELWNERSHTSWSSTLDYASLQRPVLLMLGTEDHLFLRQAQHMVQKVPDIQLAWLPEAGHYPQLECPDTFAKEAAAFLQKVLSVGVM